MKQLRQERDSPLLFLQYSIGKEESEPQIQKEEDLPRNLLTISIIPKASSRSSSDVCRTWGTILAANPHYPWLDPDLGLGSDLVKDWKMPPAAPLFAAVVFWSAAALQPAAEESQHRGPESVPIGTSDRNMALDQALSCRFILTSNREILQLSQCCSRVLPVMLSSAGAKLLSVRGKPITFELYNFNTAKFDPVHKEDQQETRLYLPQAMPQHITFERTKAEENKTLALKSREDWPLPEPL
ncbi:hypothetical protein llap_8535 [Limosa lapponica baueri]|uniref:Uncharacterized protein n=1 Tax=Limosa lapponica baueri TaxID=1758121 RepID=A0A2I0U528_LIMLA|nr:hypothetical protein llap_8535 [Limosa lapponica baueri]